MRKGKKRMLSYTQIESKRKERYVKFNHKLFNNCVHHNVMWCRLKVTSVFNSLHAITLQ